MDKMDAAHQPVRVHVPWWKNRNFSVVPQFDSRAPDRWNTTQYRFDWLFFHLWTLDSCDLAFEVSLHSYGSPTGLKVGLTLPYLKVLFCLPIPLGNFMYRFWRKPEGV